MEAQSTSKPKGKKREYEFKIGTIYSKCLITRTITLLITQIGKNLKSTIEKKIKRDIEGNCLVEGYVKPNSTIIISYSSGIVSGDSIRFDIVIECEVCFPVEGMILNCLAINITKAGIRAESATEQPSPIVVFIARDHHYNLLQFSKIKENDKFNARIIGQRFELNDKYVSVIAELVIDKDKPKIVVET